MSHSDHFINLNTGLGGSLIGPSNLGIDKQARMELSEDHFDNWIDPTPSSYDERYKSCRKRWERVKQDARERHYEQVKLYRVAIDSPKLRGDLRTAIAKTNDWLARNELVGYPDSPTSVFINFFKKEVRQDRSIDKAVRGNSVNLDCSKGYISALSFYDIYWPTYAMGFFNELCLALKAIDFEALRLMKTDSTVVEIGTNVKEVMAPGLSRLLAYKF